MRYFDAFSGYGGFSLGIQQAYDNRGLLQGKTTEDIQGDSANFTLGQDRPTCIGFSEVDKYAVQVYSKHFPEHKNYGDITKIKAEELPDFDLFVGGFPCQAFSIAGKRAGFEDTRGTLIYDVLRILRGKQPVYALLENVKGLISHDGGKTLEIILASLQELGYYSNYEIRNAKDYGVPQNRERIFILCKHIKLLSDVGQNEKMTSSENIIQEWLFTLLLNDLNEVKKLQGHASKDWVVGWLLCHAISQNQEWNAGNILDGISTDTVGKSFPSMGEPWQNIDIWLKETLGENLLELKSSTISTAIKQIIGSKTYTYSKMFQSILLATVLLRQSSSHLWNEVLSSLILIQENTKYARINSENEETIVTEYGTAHFSSELQDPTKYFTLSHLGGFGGRQVFPIGTDGAIHPEQESSQSTCLKIPLISQGDKAMIEITRNVSDAQRIYSPKGIGKTLKGLGGGQGAKTGLYEIPEATKQGFTVAEEGDSINLSVINSKTRRGRVGKGIAQTLDTGMHQHTIDKTRIRRLTPTECERLMGLPDGWTAEGTEGKISDTQRYKLCGNGVVVNIVEEIIKRLI